MIHDFALAWAPLSVLSLVFIDDIIFAYFVFLSSASQTKHDMPVPPDFGRKKYDTVRTRLGTNRELCVASCPDWVPKPS